MVLSVPPDGGGHLFGETLCVHKISEDNPRQIPGHGRKSSGCLARGTPSPSPVEVFTGGLVSRAAGAGHGQPQALSPGYRAPDDRF